MSDSPTEGRTAAMSADASALADRLIRPLANRYLLVLTAIAALIVLDQAVIQPQLMRLNFYAPVINIAGRQRMLSQKLCKEALAIELEQQPAARRKLCSELLATLRRWSTAHQALEQGSRELNLQPIRSPRILNALHDLEPHFRAMQHAAEELAADQGQPGAGGEQSGTERRVRVMLNHEPDYLSGMERAVGMLEAASQEQVAWLRGGALVAMLLATAVARRRLLRRAAARHQADPSTIGATSRQRPLPSSLGGAAARCTRSVGIARCAANRGTARRQRGTAA